jgi:hypothetical protein
MDSGYVVSHIPLFLTGLSTGHKIVVNFAASEKADG